MGLICLYIQNKLSIDSTTIGPEYAVLQAKTELLSTPGPDRSGNPFVPGFSAKDWNV